MSKVPRISYYDLTDLFIEDLGTEEYVIAHYLVSIPRNLDPDTVAHVIALEELIGTWIRVSAETPEMRRRYAAKVIGLYKIPDYEFEIPGDINIRKFILSIAFPWRNFGFDISIMLSIVIGNIASAGKLKLLDLWFPKKFLKCFKGSRYCIDGLRRYIGIYDRPLIIAMSSRHPIQFLDNDPYKPVPIYSRYLTSYNTGWKRNYA
ncbi:Ribulose 1 5-bisphosphate carboxylase large subunit-like protein [Staphylothermus hellenicus]|uniref:Ribulose 1 5-bisphosphate carboxylase large subunit-like protein n=1 Tax=Staphylothermus hellenicus (strain DSM 12710 / JCM 10830 / BK20S6-10-b1 / P8) TaxID=591019 RepID=D7D864_STAHD|nr:Ribulose 1 5-bisphosphate carboxylase large subunit-like protein [Staphylothermus hellenicus]ADI31960.1 Ribulose 1 5-bisphosphate carboxylase large subunit-like protein [Staphylothermus hellenicus DSM 12710]